MSFILPARAAVSPASVSTTGSGVATVLPDQSTVVKFLGDGTFTVPDGATARLLLVGGGGAGGRDCSGGGGAGGMVEASDVILAAGTYTVTVGAGGQPNSSSSVPGGNGGDTVLVDPDSTELYRAYGGGGGGSWGSTSGANGGSGGGATSNGSGGTGVDGQGYAGGDAGNRAPAGGGGAGGAGTYGSNGNGPGTAGGPGKASDITGETVYYAGGGGGGGFNYATAPTDSTWPLLNGGIGGGGNGVRNVSVATRQATTLPDGRNEYDAEAGVDGLGGGGGGANNSDLGGRPGGSGVLIVRLDPVAAGPEPQIVVSGVENALEASTVRVFLLSVGDGGSTATVSYKVAASVAGLDAATAVVAASDATAGTVVPISLTGLQGGKAVYVRVFAENDLGVAAASVDATANPLAGFDPASFDMFATFTVAGYAGLTDLANFPVLVRLAANSPEDFSYGDCAADGSDLRFADADGNLVPHEIDTWDTAGESLVWVRLPVLADGATFTMYYGSSSPGEPSYEDVWTRYAAVIHGGDAIANAVAGGPIVKAGSTSVAAAADAGKVGGGIRKSVANAIGVNVAMGTDAASLADAGKYSVSGWFKRNGNGGSNNGTHVLGASRTAWQGGQGFLWLQEQGRYISVAANGAHQWSSGSYTFPNGEWAYGAFTYESGVSLTSYFNGVQDQTKSSPGNLVSSVATWTFGSYANTGSGDSFIGDMDELRIFDGVASADWIKAEHDTVADAAFLAAGAAQANDPDAPRIASAAVVEDILRLDVSFVCSLDGATVSYRLAAAGEDVDETTPVVVTNASVADATISIPLPNLVGDATYTIRLEAEKDGHAARPVTLAASPFAADPAFTPSVAANDARTRAGGDEVHVLSASGTFTLATRRRARLLAVGGGGGSGWPAQSSQSGAGGGAGGMLEASNVLLRAGTYRYEVGAGGAASTANGSRGANGGDTLLYWTDPATGTETLVAQAYGGGGGGSYDTRDGASGGSGGGGHFRETRYVGAPGAGVSGQGNAGGGWTSQPSATSGSSGGGGAGAPGETGTATKGGDGGDGRASDITGSEVWYAGGGGASRMRNNIAVATPGKGGRGGGGDGANYGWYTGDARLQGADGLGGGGGGGFAWYHNSSGSQWYNCYGGKGGSGTLVLRFDAPDEPAPAFESAAAEITDRTEATFSGVVKWEGDGASGADLVLTMDGASETVATGLKQGDAFSVAKTVARGASVAWSLKLVNSLGVESTAESGTLAVPADAPVAITTTGESRTFAVGNDTVAVFTNTAAAGSFTVPAGGAWVELLVVGGGGAGGRAWEDNSAAAGGGAGGFVHKPALFLEQGTYSVTVGAGGKGREDGVKEDSGRAGRSGGPSFVTLGGADVARAYGGSGGAGRNAGNLTNNTSSVGFPKGSTGGAGRAVDSNYSFEVEAQAPTDPSQGNPGGGSRSVTVSNSSGTGTYWLPGGGGGAGAPGGDADPVAILVGAGGDGLPCSITGEEVWYAGGGGAGSGYGAPGGVIYPAMAGGKGGGGYGQRWQRASDADNRGVDGLGGGGGGGGGADGNDDNVARAITGHSGGCGTVIVRWRAKAVANVELAPDEPVAGFRRGTVSGSVASAGGDGATVAVEIGLCASGSSATNWTQVATGLAAGETYSYVFDGLANATAYDVAWRATSSAGGEATGDAGSFTTVSGAYLVPGSGSEGATITQVGADSVYTYSNSAAAGTFVVQQAGYARLLLAGGGGAGGYYRGGGGGGGGVIEEELVWLEAGTYSITVGAGGTPSTGSGTRGGSGGNSVLSGPGLSLTAYGGGGGGSWTDNENGRGADGGSGGGSARRRETTAGTGVAGQGHDGAPSRRRDLGNVEDYWSAGGGGGAGSPGVQASSDHTVAGAGGAGRASDISGTEQQYGAGGGASCTHLDSNAAGEGGDGIGGHGRRNEYTTYWFGDEPGRAGYGGGGGGGADRDANSNFIRPGAPGGCGTVIIRFATAPAGLPDAAVIAAEPSASDPTAASVTVVVRSLGGKPSATLSLAYGATMSSLPLRFEIGEVTETGTVDAQLPGLEPGKTYYVAAAISTSAGETVTRAVEVTIPVAGALDGAGAAGLWQAFWTRSATDRDPNIWTNVTVKNAVAGTIAAIGTGDAVDPFTGDTYPWTSRLTMFLYRGAIFLKGGTTYTFGSRMDDSLYLKIGDTVLIDTQADPSHSVFADFTAPWTGWYPIDVRLGNEIGDWTKHGPDGDGVTSWTSFALAFNTEGSRSMIPESAWTTLIDSGDGSFLRTEDPGLRYADLLGVSATAGGSLALTPSVAPGSEKVHAYLCYGPAWQSNDPTAWTRTDLGEVAAADAATDLASQTVAGWGSSAVVAAVALVHPDGTVTWSAPVTYAGTSLLSLSASATDWSQGDELTVSFDVSGGTAPYTATLYVGNGPGSLERAARTTLSAAGSGTLTATGLTPSATYYWQVVVTDASGASASTDPSANVEMPGAAQIVNSSVGISWTLDQRTATLNGSLLKLGAGDNWAWLYVTDHLSERWSDIRAFFGSTTNIGEKVLLTDTGAFSITHTFDWGEEIGFNWVLSNSNGRVTYVDSRKPNWNSNDSASAAHFWAGDFQTYTWKGGSGLWNDPEKWEPDGTMEGHEQAGYPVTGSIFAFDAGESEVALVPGAFVKPVAFDLRQNAVVTIKGTAEASDFGLLRTDKPVRRQASYIREGACLVLSGVKGRLAPRDDNGTTIYFGGQNAGLVFTNACDVDLGWGYGNWGIEDWSNNRQGRGIRFTGGSKVYIRGCLGMAGPNEYVIDDSQVTMAPNTSRDDCRVEFALRDGGRFVFRGAHPLLVCNNRFSARTDTNPTGEALQFVDFEIPVGGFAEAPLRSREGNTYKLGVTGGSSRQMAFRVPTNSPVASVKGLVEQPLIYWPAGKEDWMLAENQYLPHPDTDEWRETYDPVTGDFTGWAAFLVGRPDIEEPQVVGLSMTNLVSGRADFFFYGIPGTNAASATFSATLERTDDPTDTSAVVELVGGTAGSVAQGARFTVAATGLADGGSYKLTINGVDDGDATLSCTEILEFGALRDYAEASTASVGATTTQDGPYTVWTFTNSAAAGTFTVTRPGVARVLVVGGGGGGGGGDGTTTNEGDTRRGGGGGGGGEVVETELYLQPGDYFVEVGAGGAAVGSQTAGKAGGRSTFAGLATAAGGGGGGGNWYSNNTWHREGAAGANGGGAAGQGAGGAATAAGGHAGGSSTYNAWANWNDLYAGAGGGGMGAAGGDAGLDALDMIAAGDGGDGVPSDITGSVVWYGGGGGGGGPGLAFGPGNGGFGGRGGGGEGRFRRTCTTFALESSAGADGLGGGGGGGASGGTLSGYATELQAYRGGKGGDGVVIVRMRTATAQTPDPQLSVRTAEPSEGGIDLEVAVHSLGEGAAAADLLLVCTPAGSGAALTNALGSVSATGLVSHAVAGLRPGTDYAGAVVATNAAGGVGSAPVAFRTAGEYHGDADSGLVAGSWTLSDWAENDTSFFEDNLLRASNGGFAARAQNRKKPGGWGTSNGNNGGWEGDLIDGVMNRTNNRFIGYGTNELVVFTLAEPSAVSSIRVFSGWGVNGGNSSIAIEGIDVRSGANEPWTPLENGACQAPASTTWGMFGTLAAGGNDWLARDVRQIRVRFDKNLAKNTNGTIYWEIEAHGAAEADAPALHARAGIGRPLAVASAMRTAAAFTGVVSAPAGAPAFADVVAVWGPAHAGEDTNDWAHARSVGPMGEAASSIPLTLTTVELDGAVYVRFCGVGADGTVSWSDSVYVPDLEELTDVPPVVVFGSCAAGATTASISANVVSAGSLSTDGEVNVTLEYTVDPDGFADGWTGTPETFAFASGAGVGALPATAVSPLQANRRYLARFVATNNGNQTGVGDVFTFDTADGGSGSDIAVGYGLLQQTVTGVAASIDSLRAAAWDETQAVAVEGAIMAYTTGSATSTKSGGTYAWGSSMGFVYRGYVHLEGGVEYTFGGSIDDAIQLTIDDTIVLWTENNAGATYGTFTPPSTGWYPVDVRMSNGGGGAGRAFGLGWNTTGSRNLDASHMSKFVDPNDGSFLRPSAARTLRIARADIAAGAVDLAAAATSGMPDGAVWAVWGATDLGTNAVPSDWTGSQTLAAAAGGDAATWTATLPIDAAATPIVRVAIVPASGDTLWSAPVLLDADDPTIGPADAATDGDRMTVSGSMASLGTGAGFSLDLLWGYKEDLSDARTNAVAVASDGAFETTVEVRPSTNGWWRLVARTTDGGVDATLPAAFETLGGSELKRLGSATVSHHTISASGTLNVLGAGETTVTVWAGSSEDDLAPVAGSSKVLSSVGPFTLEALVPGDPHTVYWKIVSENVAPGGTTWTSETPVYSIATTDAATYTWKLEKTEGDWNDPANWTVSGVDANDCLGYPNHAKASVVFQNGTKAEIAVPAGTWYFDHMDLNVNSLDLAFVGEGAGATTLNGNVWGAGNGSAWNGWTNVFDNLTLYEANTIQLGGVKTQNATLRFQNGAVYSLAGWQESKGTNVWLEAVGGSQLYWRNGDGDNAGLTLWVAGGGLLLEDSTANPPNFNYERGNGSVGDRATPGDQSVLLKGESVFRIRRYGRPYSETEDSGTFGTLTITFTVPLDGWEAGVNTPVYANYVRGTADNKKFAWRSEGKECPVTLSVDKDSPLLRSGRSRTWAKGNAVQLLEWCAGIDTKNVVLEDRKGVHMYYTYGFPQVRTTPNSEDEIPTGVAADIVGQGATIFLVF